MKAHAGTTYHPPSRRMSITIPLRVCRRRRHSALTACQLRVSAAENSAVGKAELPTSACESAEPGIVPARIVPAGCGHVGGAHPAGHGGHQGRVLVAAWKVPVGASSARVARVTMISAPCSTVLFPEWWLRSVAT